MSLAFSPPPGRGYNRRHDRAEEETRRDVLGDRGSRGAGGLSVECRPCVLDGQPHECRRRSRLTCLSAIDMGHLAEQSSLQCPVMVFGHWLCQRLDLGLGQSGWMEVVSTGAGRAREMAVQSEGKEHFFLDWI